MTQKIVAISGASGLLGTHLSKYLQAEGYTVRNITRAPKTPDDIYWNPDKGELDPADLTGVNILINYGGEAITAKRWSPKQKAYLISNREACSKVIARAARQMATPPELVIFGSGLGYYGAEPIKEFSETDEPGDDMPAKISIACENGAELLKDTTTRSVILRTALVISGAGGALSEMLPSFKLGLGGTIGSGKQWWGWIDIADHARAVKFLIENPELSGPFNLCSPYNVNNAEFTQVLGSVLNRPTFMPVNPFFLRVMFGEVAEHFLVKGAKAEPIRLINSGFEFKYPLIQIALRRALGK